MIQVKFNGFKEATDAEFERKLDELREFRDKQTEATRRSFEITFKSEITVCCYENVLKKVFGNTCVCVLKRVVRFVSFRMMVLIRLPIIVARG